MADHEDLPLQRPSPPLQIHPTTLCFPPPFNRVITQLLKIRNTREEFVAFKVKTTSPKRYCVRPNLGIIPPGDSVDVQVLLNSIKDPPTDTQCQDRFQVQSFVLEKNAKAQSLDLKELWKSVSERDITKQRLKCRFEHPSTVHASDRKASSRVDERGPSDVSSPSPSSTPHDWVFDLDSPTPTDLPTAVALVDQAKGLVRNLTLERDDLRKKVALNNIDSGSSGLRRRGGGGGGAGVFDGASAKGSTAVQGYSLLVVLLAVMLMALVGFLVGKAL
eukprot:TRINITY_DN765_c0_g1_i2.p1 TRINITY_DN765_c0_g1~~TRINITY_DN765_c0_g1_i2.p1  ORF type:complete len:286 (-),score=44.22 TRINITY_DN765_c0_g1_i2:718-1542(-)